MAWEPLPLEALYTLQGWTGYCLGIKPLGLTQQTLQFCVIW